MPLRQCMAEHTERERDAWLYWIGEHQHDMTLTDNYLWAILTEIRRSWVKQPARVKPEQLKLKFERRESKPIIRDKQVISQISQARWMGIIGMKRGKD